MGVRPVVAPRLAVAAALVAVSVTLCGCDVPRVEGYINGFDLDLNIDTHKIPLWRQMVNYCLQSSYEDPVTKQRRWNTCMDANLSALDTCSQHGRCEPFDENDPGNPIFFCRCDMDWCGLECEVRRKSQSTVFILSFTLGMFGVDEYYMGNLHEAIMKLCILFCGLTVAFLKGPLQSMDLPGMELHNGLVKALIFGPWLYDIVRIGSAPVNTLQCPLAADLPRWAFTSFTVMWVAFHALGEGIVDMYYSVLKKRRDWDSTRMMKYNTTTV